MFGDLIESKVINFNDNPDLADDIALLEGDVLQLKTEEGGVYKTRIENGKFARANADDEPTISFESSEEVITSIISGELDPLEVLNTRKLVAKTDATKGRIIRRIFFGEDF